MPTGSPTRMDYPEQGEVRAWDDTLKRWVPVPVSAAVDTDGVPFAFNETVTITPPDGSEGIRVVTESGEDNHALVWNLDGTDVLFLDSNAWTLRFDSFNVYPEYIGPANAVTGAAKLAADAFYRWIAHVDGSMEWGPGAAGPDTFLRRVAAGQLAINGDPGETSTTLVLERDHVENGGMGGRILVRGRWTGDPGPANEDYGWFGIGKTAGGNTHRSAFILHTERADEATREVQLGHFDFGGEKHGLMFEGDAALWREAAGLLQSDALRLDYDRGGAASLLFGPDGIGIRGGGADPGLVFHLDNDGATLLTVEGKADEVLFSTNRASLRFGIAGKLLGFYGADPAAQPALVADPAGGAVQDAEARAAIAAVIDALQGIGLMAAA